MFLFVRIMVSQKNGSGIFDQKLNFFSFINCFCLKNTYIIINLLNRFLVSILNLIYSMKYLPKKSVLLEEICLFWLNVILKLSSDLCYPDLYSGSKFRYGSGSSSRMQKIIRIQLDPDTKHWY